MSKILITGTSGFIGSALAQSMAQNHDVVCLSRGETQVNGVTAIQGDFTSPADLRKKGTHPELGTVTLENLLATWVIHDQNHIHQIAKCLGYQYRELVGPWGEFLMFVIR